MEKLVDVSVIVPYYKANKTIIRSLESIFAQTVSPKEVIIIDDFSNSIEDNKILEYIENTYKVKIIRLKKNMGAGTARNKGLKMATSKYIAFLDSDDSWSENKLEIQYNIMQDTGAFISTHHTSIQGEIEMNTDNILTIKPYKQLLKNRFATRAVMVLNNNLYFFENGKRYAEDYLLWTQITYYTNSAIYIDKTLAYSYKENYGDNGLTGDLKQMYYGILDAYQILKKEKIINKCTYEFLRIYQTLKYFYRVIRLSTRKNH